MTQFCNEAFEKSHIHYGSGTIWDCEKMYNGRDFEYWWTIINNMYPGKIIKITNVNKEKLLEWANSL